jgi:hypothetical protein
MLLMADTNKASSEEKKLLPALQKGTQMCYNIYIEQEAKDNPIGARFMTMFLGDLDEILQALYMDKITWGEAATAVQNSANNVYQAEVNFREERRRERMDSSRDNAKLFDNRNVNIQPFRCRSDYVGGLICD